MPQGPAITDTVSIASCRYCHSLYGSEWWQQIHLRLLLKNDVKNHERRTKICCRIRCECSRPIARPWTQWMQRKPQPVHISTHVNTSIERSIMHMICVGTTTWTLQLHDALCNSAQNIVHIHTFLKMNCYQPQQHVDAVVCHTFFIWLTGMFMFDILQIPSWCVLICKGLTTPTAAMATGMDCST